MSENTKELWRFHEQGDADDFCILTASGKWVIAFHMNGEMLPARQREIGRRIVACVNACAGVPTEALEIYKRPAFHEAWKILAEVEQQRDELLAQLIEADAALELEGLDKDGSTRKPIRAAIAKAKP